jgi:hypothetical protein
MDWRRTPGADPADPHGVADLLARACAEVSGSSVEGTRFLFSTAEMLRVSREIEQASMVSPADALLVGVQRGHRLGAQAEVYAGLVGAGVKVRAYGTDEGTPVPDIEWVQVAEDPFSLEASWFLARSGDLPHVLVGFELDPAPDGRRRWEGFESRDPRLVEGILAHLDDIATGAGPGADRPV